MGYWSLHLLPVTLSFAARALLHGAQEPVDGNGGDGNGGDGDAGGDGADGACDALRSADLTRGCCAGSPGALGKAQGERKRVSDGFWSALAPDALESRLCTKSAPSRERTRLIIAHTEQVAEEAAVTVALAVLAALFVTADETADATADETAYETADKLDDADAVAPLRLERAAALAAARGERVQTVNKQTVTERLLLLQGLRANASSPLRLPRAISKQLNRFFMS
jgi:hypothetical protein